MNLFNYSEWGTKSAVVYLAFQSRLGYLLVAWFNDCFMDNFSYLSLSLQ